MSSSSYIRWQRLGLGLFPCMKTRNLSSLILCSGSTVESIYRISTGIHRPKMRSSNGHNQRHKRARTPAVGEDAAKDVVSGVGQIASDLFDAPSLRKPVKKYSKKILRFGSTPTRSNLLAQCETTFNSLLIEAKNFLSNISFVLKGTHKQRK